MRNLMLMIIFIAGMQSSFLNAGSLTERSTYPQFCQQAVDNEAVFATFKRNPIFNEFMEHVTYEQGKAYLDYIKKDYPNLLHYVSKFSQNDLLGNPVTYDYGPGVGRISPTTLRYIKVAGDLIKEFGMTALKQMHILEIGGGYGGQAKIFADLGIGESYTIIDISPAIALTEKYLNRLGIYEVQFVDSTKLDQLGQYNLLISNYAFSELDSVQQIDYLEKVINPVPNGFMILNYYTYPFLSIEEIRIQLNSGFREINVADEKPQTGSVNKTITWRPKQ